MLEGHEPALPLWLARSHGEGERMLRRLDALHLPVRRFRKTLERGKAVRGYSITARRMVDFDVAWPAGDGEPNWRETVRCPESGCIARLRGAWHAYRTLRPAGEGDRLYLTEGATEFARFVSAARAGTVTSEFYPDVAPGAAGPGGVRCEDLTQLSFADASFDALMSFEVLEHVPDYRAALAECARVLAPGGVALLTAPFVHQPETIVRASLGTDGEVVHHLDPDWHGDPINPGGGILCYYWFGWSLLDDLRAAGFRDAAVAYYCSREFGYLGGMEPLFVAWR